MFEKREIVGALSVMCPSSKRFLSELKIAVMGAVFEFMGKTKTNAGK